jgi:apolipoprotein N-acyltransferase
LLDLAARHDRLSAIALGALAACGFEPLGLWPLTLLALTGLISLVEPVDTGKRAALLGWLFGVGHFTLGNNWIATSFNYQAEMPVWLGGIAVLLLSLYLAVYPLLGVLAAWWLRRRLGLPLVPVFAATWIVSEWLRAWVFTGFAWNPLAMAALGPFDRPGLAGMVAPWMGTYAVSGLVVLLAGCWQAAARLGWKDWRAAGLVAVPVIAMLLPHLPPVTPALPGSLAFTLVQPDVRQEDLNDPAQWEEQFQRTARLSLPRAGQAGPRVVFWSESGVPDYLRDGYPQRYYDQMTFAADPGIARRRIGRAAGPGGLVLTGATDLEIRGGRAVAARNVITAIDGNGTIRSGYAKAHLVPYGEYLALRWLLEPLGATRLVPGALDFWPGPGPRTLDLGPWGKAGMQICYEIVFSGQVVDPARRPDYLFNPSNDGWFGAWGPPQHLAQARMRAIEEGLPVLRATTTGISAVIGPDGIVRQFVPRHVADRLDGTIPPALPPTLFSQWGNALALGWAAVLLALSFVAKRPRKR